MLQCPQLADSCLALGQASCRRARELTHQYASEGEQRSPSTAERSSTWSARADGATDPSLA